MLKDLLKRIIPVEGHEARAVLLAFAYGFCIFLSYSILRPVRDEISAEDRGNLQWLWTAVFFVMLGAVPLYSAVVSRFQRGVFIPLVYGFFISNILIFYACLRVLPEEARPWIDRVFYVWLSVFNLFVVTVFWGFMADLFRNEQGKRLFGFPAAGVSLGGVVGASVPAFLATYVEVFNLMLIAAVPLVIASWLARRLHHTLGLGESAAGVEEDRPVAGGALSGIATLFGSPYLLMIGWFIALMTFANTILYFLQADLVEAAISERGERRELLARVDLVVNALTLFTQGVLFAYLARTVGIAVCLAVIPALASVGFLVLGIYPLLIALIIMQVLYRSGRYAIAKPAREVLFTVVGREEKYKSKSFVDTAVYRGGDLVSGWIYTGLAWIGLSVGAIAVVAAPVAAMWAAIGFKLGRQQEDLAARPAVPALDESPVG